MAQIWLHFHIFSNQWNVCPNLSCVCEQFTGSASVCDTMAPGTGWDYYDSGIWTRKMAGTALYIIFCDRMERCVFFLGICISIISSCFVWYWWEEWSIHSEWFRFPSTTRVRTFYGICLYFPEHFCTGSEFISFCTDGLIFFGPFLNRLPFMQISFGVRCRWQEC